MKAVSRSATIEEVRRCLLNESSIGEQDIENVLAETRRRLKGQAKAHGRHVAQSGCLLIVAAFGLLILTGGLFFASGAAILGVLMLTAGVIKAWTGWNLTGRDFE